MDICALLSTRRHLPAASHTNSSKYYFFNTYLSTSGLGCSRKKSRHFCTILLVSCVYEVGKGRYLYYCRVIYKAVAHCLECFLGEAFLKTSPCPVYSRQLSIVVLIISQISGDAPLPFPSPLGGGLRVRYHFSPQYLESESPKSVLTQ